MQLEQLQDDTDEWAVACFGVEATYNKDERNHRFLEEALELVQSTGCTKADALDLVEYVFNRDIGVPHQEAGGVLVSLAALANANDIHLAAAATDGLGENWERIDKIREKQKNKPKFGPRAC
jgi:hypothetical protein